MFNKQEFLDSSTGKECDPNITATLPDNQTTPIFQAGDTGEDSYYEINLIDNASQPLVFNFKNNEIDLGQVTIPLNKLTENAGEWTIDEVFEISPSGKEESSS